MTRRTDVWSSVPSVSGRRSRAQSSIRAFARSSASPATGSRSGKPRRRRKERKGLHRDRLPDHVARCRGGVAGRAVATQSRTLDRGKPESPTKELRLRRARPPDPHQPRSREPGQHQQHRARGDLRQPPRSGEPRRKPPDIENESPGAGKRCRRRRVDEPGAAAWESPGLGPGRQPWFSVLSSHGAQRRKPPPG